MFVLASVNPSLAGESQNEHPLIAGRIGSAGSVTAARSIGQFVRQEVEMLCKLQVEPMADNELSECAFNAIIEQRVRCAYSLMKACGELATDDHPRNATRAEQIREDLRCVLSVARTEIEDHRRLMTAILGPNKSSDSYSEWFEKTVARLADRVARYEPPLNDCHLEYRETLVSELSQLCVRMMRDYSRLEAAVAHNAGDLPLQS